MGGDLRESIETRSEKVERLAKEIAELEQNERRTIADIDSKFNSMSSNAQLSTKDLSKLWSSMEELQQKELELFLEKRKKQEELLSSKQSARKIMYEIQEKILGAKEKGEEIPYEYTEAKESLLDLFNSSDVGVLMGSVMSSTDALSVSVSIDTEVEGHVTDLKKWEIDPKDLEINETVRLGTGNFGDVYRGTYMDTAVAVKKLLDQKLDDDSKARFANEAKLLASLRHPNIVMLIGVCTAPGKYSIVTEYMSKGSLSQLLKADKRISFRKRMKIARGTAQGMNWLHNLKSPQGPILHLDLKPANLLVDSHFNVKIADFGLAHTKETQRKGKVGTPIYMAPEILAGKEYDSKADVYSFGIILWELANPGKDPYEGKFKGQEELKEAVLRGIRPNMNKMGPILTKIINSCLNPDPTQRPTFKEMLQDKLFDQIIIEGVISEENSSARLFWQKALFPIGFTVPWKDFCNALRRHWKAPLRDFENSVKYDCLQIVMGATIDNVSKEALVSIEAFSNVLQWFGPVEDGKDLLNKVFDLASQSWFHGGISITNAEKLLSKPKTKDGTFLIRFSESSVGAYTITVRAKAPGLFSNNKNNIKHLRVAHSPGQKFVIGNKEFNSLQELVKKVNREVPKIPSLISPCSGSVFESLINAHKVKFDPVCLYIDDDEIQIMQFKFRQEINRVSAHLF